MAGAVTAGKHSAPWQWFGYSLQDVRLAFHLLDSPDGSYVSLEHIDDVAVHRPDGVLIWEQDKSAKSGNPLADSSPEFWKTLANWVEDCDATVSSRFQLYVFPNKKWGAFASAMHAAKSPADVEAFCVLAKKKLKTAGETLKEHLERFLAAPVKNQVHVILNAQVLPSDADPLDPLRKALGAGLAAPLKEICCKYIVGNAQAIAQAQIISHHPVKIDASDFRRDLEHYVRRINMQGLLPNAPKAHESDVIKAFEARPIFLRQLEIIGAEKAARMRAVADYLQAAASMSEWAESALILQNAFEAWSDALVNQHEALREGINEAHAGLSAESRGRMLFAECRRVKEKLDGHDVSFQVVAGSFHNLANEMRLGWHDDYEKLLGSDL